MQALLLARTSYGLCHPKRTFFSSLCSSLLEKLRDPPPFFEELFQMAQDDLIIQDKTAGGK